MPEAHEALSILFDLTQTFTRLLSLERVLQEISDAALRLLPGNHSSVRILNDARTELLRTAQSGEGADAPPVTFRKGEGILGWVVDYGRVARLDDTSQDSRFIQQEGQAFAVRSVTAVPISVGQKVIGVLSVSSPVTGAFTKGDETMLQLLANASVPMIEKARLERLALFDDLTLAYKDNYLLPRLQDEMQTARQSGSPLSILLLDLDRLKRVYEEHSFTVGDQVLRGFADRVRELSHSSHQLVRRGGGNFVLIMPQTDTDRAQSHAEMVRSDLDQRPLSVSGELSITQRVSIGVATWDGEEDGVRLFRRAEDAVREAKDQGRNQVVLAKS